MKKKFNFKIEKETIIELSKNQQSKIGGGGYTDGCPTANTCPSDIDCPQVAPTTLCNDGSNGCTPSPSSPELCNTVGCPVGTSMAAGCSGNTTNQANTCNSTFNNCTFGG